MVVTNEDGKGAVIVEKIVIEESGICTLHNYIVIAYKVVLPWL